MSHPIKPVRRIAAISMLLVICGCAREETEREPRVDTRPMVSEIRQAEQDWAWVSGQRWQLARIDGQPPIEGTELTLRFREHTWLEGLAGCNRYTASYVRKAEAGLSVSEIISTRMFCAQPKGVMQQESRFFHLLQQIDAYHAEPDRLDLLSDGAVVLSFGHAPETIDVEQQGDD
ncbi:MAG: META domain-containing protein [Phycisphaerales bacterium]